MAPSVAAPLLSLESSSTLSLSSSLALYISHSLSLAAEKLEKRLTSLLERASFALCLVLTTRLVSVGVIVMV